MISCNSSIVSNLAAYNPPATAFESFLIIAGSSTSVEGYFDVYFYGYDDDFYGFYCFCEIHANNPLFSFPADVALSVDFVSPSSDCF
jgi:hypothetical protein